MKIISDPISVEDLKMLAKNFFDDMIKGVVDVEKQQLALNAELHSDLEALLLENGSHQKNIWGINLYPDLAGEEDFIEFDSMINLKPSQGNRSRGVDNEEIRDRIKKIVYSKVALP